MLISILSSAVLSLSVPAEAAKLVHTESEGGSIEIMKGTPPKKAAKAQVQPEVEQPPAQEAKVEVKKSAKPSKAQPKPEASAQADDFEASSDKVEPSKSKSKEDKEREAELQKLKEHAQKLQAEWGNAADGLTR